MASVVRNNAARHRYELSDGEEVVAIEDYDVRGENIALVHTEVFAGHEGKGYARTLVEEVLADVRAQGLGVLPECPYVRKVIAEHPADYLDLVPSAVRAKFRLPAASSAE